jgi:hypothetical protein
LGFPGAETPKPIHAKPIRGFAYRDFTTGEDEGSCPWVSRVPKRRNLFTLNRFGVSGMPKHRNLFSDWRRRGVLPLGFPGAEMPKPIHAKPIRGFAYQDFTTGEDEGSCPLVSRVPKRRNLRELLFLVQGFQTPIT